MAEDRPAEDKSLAWRQRPRIAQHEIGHFPQGLTALARRYPTPTNSWQALVASGQYEEERGDPSKALEFYLAAEGLRDALLLSLAAGGSRERSLADWDLSARRAIDLQVRLGALGGAVCTARLARSRTLRAIEGLSILDGLAPDQRALIWRDLGEFQAAVVGEYNKNRRGYTHPAELAATRRRDWSIQLRASVLGFVEPSHESMMSPSCAELSPPADDEVIVVYYPISNQVWMGLASDGTETRAHAFDLHEAEQDATREAALLGPFFDLLEGAAKVRFIAAGRLLHRDLHTTPWQGDMLFRQRIVSYGLDRIGAAGGAVQRFASLVIEGQDSDLDNTHDETEIVEESLRFAGMSTRKLTGSELPHESLLHAIGSLELLHFSGHAGTPEALGGHGPSTLALKLSDDQWLGPEEILTLRRAPRAVFISACSAGQVDPTLLGGGAGLQQILIARGADIVIAASIDVDDQIAADLAALVYEFDDTPGRRGPEILTPEALQYAQITLLDGDLCDSQRHECFYRAWVR